MNIKALKSLEFNKITEQLSQKAASTMGKARAAELAPLTDLAEILRAQRQTSEAAAIILNKGSLPLGGIYDIRAALARAGAGGMLAAEELLQVGECLYVFKKVFNYGKNCDAIQLLPNTQKLNQSGENRESALIGYFSAIGCDDELEDEINRCIKPSGEVADNASQALAQVRRSIRTAHDKIRDSLQGIIQSAAYKNMLQDAIVTLRGERFCVPVKAEYRGSFPGMVHDQSSTGATVFMEPLSVVELNNKIKDLHFEEKREIEKILYRLSGMVWGSAEMLEANLQIITHLDFVFAKGEMSLQMKATEPVFNDRGYVNIRKGRHPLLNAQAVVPTDIHLGGEFSMLLITGPNTGGKTVTLKTVGLFTLMGQAGLHIPAFDNSELAVFDEVFADIGDEQSIEQSLSTFSSHMTNIVGILDKVTPNSLVLLDELGAGTDPTEGAALATALLSHLHERKIRTVVTTHYSELKLYALSTEGVENAGCEFNIQTLRPTYRLLIGIPGKSNAFAIAKRLGLSDAITDNARELLSQTDIKFEDVITDLEASKKQVQIEQDRASQYRRDAEKLREDAAKLEEKLRTQREKILLEAREDAQQVVKQTRKEAEAIINELRKQLANIQSAEVEEARRLAREGLTAVESALLPAEEKPARTPPKNLKRGDRVIIHSMNTNGTVLSSPDANGEVQIQAGIMKIKAHISDLSLDEEEPAEKGMKFFKHRQAAHGKSSSISPEIDLRGLLTDEAVSKAEIYLNEVSMSSLSTVTIIHGKGTGALKKAIHAMLKRYPNIKEFRLGKYGEGEDGVTIVTFK